MKEKIKVIELFAGVGGFRIGLEGWNGKSCLSEYKQDINSDFKVIWSNQWEPSTKTQHASNIYINRFGSNSHSNEDITKVNTSDIPDFDMLVGGFPCQDYSVANQLGNSKGIVGKKGVLWWEIHRILCDKLPKVILLENVDRLLKSPSNQRGKDFAIILSSLSDLGYIVEWKVINAADYGMPQRRKRIFILGYRMDNFKIDDPINWITKSGILSKSFETKDTSKDILEFNIEGDLVEITNNFNNKKIKSPFLNTGIIINRKVWTVNTEPIEISNKKTIKDIALDISLVNSDFFLSNESIDRWKYLKGSKKEKRIKPNGDIFYYSEGPLSFPDSLDKPMRTIITGEGGKGPSRFKHVILQNNILRRLTPIELERANMFPDNHTIGVSDSKRAFLMGNALVIGIVERISINISNFLKCNLN